MAFSRVNLTYHDYNEESSQVGYRGEEMTAVNFADVLAEQEALITATEGISKCLLVKEMIIATEDKPASGPSSDPDAQREIKWLVRAYDTTTGQAVNVTVPGADTSLLLPNSDKMDPEKAAYIAYVAAFEAYQLSIGGNAVEVIEIIKVGRNL